MKYLDELNVALIYGGISDEREVSSWGAHFLYSTLCTVCKSIIPIVILKSGHWQQTYPPNTRVQSDTFLLELNPTLSDTQRVWAMPQQGLWHNMLTPKPLNIDASFIILHGEGGEDGTVQALLHAAGISYTGSNALSSGLTLNKIHSKQIVKESGIPVLDFFELKGGNKHTVASATETLFNHMPPPYIVKPCNGGSSLGICRVDKKNKFIDALRTAYKYETHIIIEKALDDRREIEVALLELHPDSHLQSHKDAIQWQDRTYLVGIGEVVLHKTPLYDYKAKYNPDKGQVEILPYADLTEPLATTVKETALAIMALLGLEGFARIDFFLSSTQELYFNEANSIPGFTNTSLFTKIFIQKGLSPREIVSEILACSLQHRH